MSERYYYNNDEKCPLKGFIINSWACEECDRMICFSGNDHWIECEKAGFGQPPKSDGNPNRLKTGPLHLTTREHFAFELLRDKINSDKNGPYAVGACVEIADELIKALNEENEG